MKKEPKESNKINKVANFANPRHSKPTKRERRLAVRMADYNKLNNNKTTGFHVPGSYNK